MKLKVREIAVFGMLGALMYASKIAMELLPNIHLLGTFIVSITVVYRRKALYPIYIFVFLTGLLNGFSTWWIPYLYIWTVLWGVTMLLPKNMPKKLAPFVYMLISGLHGLAYGTLYAPFQALIMKLDFQATLTWIATGLPFDITHAVSNLICGILICPFIAILSKAEKFAK